MKLAKPFYTHTHKNNIIEPVACFEWNYYAREPNEIVFTTISVCVNDEYPCIALLRIESLRRLILTTKCNLQLKACILQTTTTTTRFSMDSSNWNFGSPLKALSFVFFFLFTNISTWTILAYNFVRPKQLSCKNHADFSFEHKLTSKQNVNICTGKTIDDVSNWCGIVMQITTPTSEPISC